MTKIYKKVGKRYKEIGAYDNELIYYPHGTHLVICQPGSTLTRYYVKPDNAAIEAAIEAARGAMAAAMSEATKLQPVKRAYTPKELEGIAAMKAVAGDIKQLRYEGVSMSDVIDAGIAVMRKALA